MTTVTHLDVEQITAYLAECKVIPEYSTINVVGQGDIALIAFLTILVAVGIVMLVVAISIITE